MRGRAAGWRQRPASGAAVGQALSNLIDNAIKYSGERKSIRVSAALEDGALALSVTDEGIGIPPAEHARIFEKFYRVGRSDTQGRRGSGVGLALVQHVAKAHDHTVPPALAVAGDESQRGSEQRADRD